MLGTANLAPRHFSGVLPQPLVLLADIIDIIIINVTDRCVLLLLYKLRFVSF